MKRKLKENNLQRFIFVFVFILLALFLFNLFNTLILRSNFEEKLAEIRESSRPAKLKLLLIKTTDCKDCFDIEAVIKAIRDRNVNITEETTLDAALQKNKTEGLIKRYGIEKLPAIILEGEINKTSLPGFKEIDGALVFTEVKPPYVDANTMEVMGRVKGVVIRDEGCSACADFGLIVQALQQNGIVFSDTKFLDYKDEEARVFINNLNIKKVPALLLSKDIDFYSLADQLSQQFEKRGEYYIFESSAPYVETETGKIRGLITLIMLTDNSCEDCYDVSVHKRILTRLGLVINEEKIIDVSSNKGEELLERYKITKVPTVILKGDIGIYENFRQIWNRVGTIEDDGAYVFREMNALGNVTYKNVS